MKRIAIIGNGITGITAARHIRKNSDDEIHVISSETMHFFARTALMYIYMGHMRYRDTKPYEDWFWKKNRINLIHKHVQRVDTGNDQLIFTDGSNFSYDRLIIASGSLPNKFGWPGQDLDGVTGFYSYQDLERVEKYTQKINHAVIVGGGLIGVELAEMLHSREVPVTMLVREDRYWGNVLPKEEAGLIQREIKANHIDLRLNTGLKEIIPDENNRVKAVLTGNDETIPCQFVGLATGVHPNIKFLEDSGIETDKGVLVDSYLRTNIENVYAAGDCAQFRDPPPGRKALEQVWYTGRMQAECLAHTIAGNPIKYRPGVWFNSAKFFNIEYQTYGMVPNQPEEGQDQFYWESEKGDQCLKIVFDKHDQSIKGINAFGLRLRQEICENWINRKISVQAAVNEFEKAAFDPEFHPKVYKKIRRAFQQKVSAGEVVI